MSRYYWWEEEPNEFQRLLQEQQASIMIGKQDLTHKDAPEEVPEEAPQKEPQEITIDMLREGMQVFLTEWTEELCKITSLKEKWFNKTGIINSISQDEELPINIRVEGFNLNYPIEAIKRIIPDTCPDCEGSGLAPGDYPEVKPVFKNCSICHGTGQAKRKLQPKTRIVFEPERKCPDCDPYEPGKINHSKCSHWDNKTWCNHTNDCPPCPTCNGTGKLGDGPEVKEAVQKKLFSLGYDWLDDKETTKFFCGDLLIIEPEKYIEECQTRMCSKCEDTCKSWPTITPAQLFEEY